MDVRDRLASEFSKFNIHSRGDMPDAMSGYTYGLDIYINRHKPYEEQTQTLGEEIGHEETTVGDISHYTSADDIHQEIQARRWGMDHLLTRDDLIELYNDAYDAAHPAAALGITNQYLAECLDNIRARFGERFTYNDYHFDLSSGVNMWPVS